ncbi:MAG: DUF1223 domain-containing protein [Terracidiphilus sp.]
MPKSFFGACARILKPSGALIVLVFVLGVQREYAAEPSGKSPVLIELFTSEGCSSCPPADALLEKIDASPPIDGTQLVVLSEHVDYWDHDGWKDPYSSHLLTERQSQYVRSFGLGSAYTPQMVLDGSTELVLSAPQQFASSIEKAAQAPKVSVQIDSASIQAGQPDMLQGSIQVNSELQKRGGDIYVATALDHANSQVLHGENGGRLLTYVAVVQDIAKVGRLEKGKSFNGNFQVKLKPGADPANLRIVVFVQEPGVGKILGVAMEKGLH